MSLRDEINSSPRGTQARLIKATGLAKFTVINALKGRQCGTAAARAIAAAYGAPGRWYELVVFPKHTQSPKAA